MKIISAILIVYLFALLVTPCSDAVYSCESEPKISLEMGHDHADESTDYCSPFCHCTCCSITLAAVDDNAPNIGEVLVNYAVLKASIYPNDALYNYHGSVWQPPKI